MRVTAVLCLALVVITASVAAPAATRKPAPRLVATTLDGKTISLAALRGKPVFINVWSSW